MYELRCLGEATLRSPTGQLIHFRSRKHLALLVYLALNADRAHRRERLAGLLWSDSEDSKARHSLSQALYAVRRRLDRAVRVEGEDLELSTEQLEVDAVKLERCLSAGEAAGAADLYRGDFLEGFWVRGAHGFEEWVGRERSRLAALARDALRETIRRASDRCDWLEVRRRSERLVNLDPYDESAYVELMRSLWMVGDRAEALDRYAKLKNVLANDLQTKPSKETDALVERIRRRVVRGGWLGRGASRETCRFENIPFIGRRQHLATLSKEWRLVAKGESRAVTIFGSAGVGKTRLVEEFINSLVLEDVTILRAACHEAEQALPYGPIAQALRDVLSEVDLRGMDPIWLAELARIVPEVRRLSGDLPEPPDLDVEGGRLRLYEGIACVLRSICDEKPALLFVDDVQWADDSSEALLHYLRRRVTNGLYMLRAYRSELPSPTSLKVHTSAGNPLRQSVIHLEPLSGPEQSELSSTLLGAGCNPKALATFERFSGGNPFYAIELARSISERGEHEGSLNPKVPESIRSIIESRIALLSAPATAILQHAAILGDRTDYRVLQTASGFGSVEFYSTLKELSQCGILAAKEDLVSFRHHLIREIATEHVPRAVKRDLSVRAARALIRSGGDPGEIATLLADAGDTDRAFAFALRGAQAAERLYALDEAANRIRLALRCTQKDSARIELIGRLGRLLYQQRRYDRARPLLRRRLAHAEKHGSPLEKIEARRDLAFLEVYAGSLKADESAHVLAQLHEDLRKTRLQADELEANILAGLFYASAKCFRHDLVDQAIKRIEYLQEHCEKPEVRYLTARALGIYHGFRGHLEHAERLLEEALESAKETGDQTAVRDVYLAYSTLVPRLLRQALVNVLQLNALPIAERCGDPASMAALIQNCALHYMYVGDLSRAESMLSKVREILETSGRLPDATACLYYNEGFLARMQGNQVAAEKSWRKALTEGKKRGLCAPVLESLAGLGLQALERNEIEKARSLAAAALRLARRGRYLLEQSFGLLDLLARLRYRAGKVEKAITDLADLASSAKERDVPLQFRALATQTEFLAELGQHDQARLVAEELRTAATKHTATFWVELANCWIKRANPIECARG